MASGKPKWFVPPFAFLLNGFFRVIANQKNHIQEEIEYDENYSRELWSWIKEDKNA
jgi:hypothetical protein